MRGGAQVQWLACNLLSARSANVVSKQATEIMAIYASATNALYGY